MPKADLLPHEAFAALFKSPTVGFGLCDRDLRYLAVNDSLASMHGIPAAAHVGKKIRDIVGDGSSKIEQKVRRVFLTGEIVLNFSISAGLPGESSFRRCNVSYFPARYQANKVTIVGGIISEITAKAQLSETIHRLSRNLTGAHSVLQRQSVSASGPAADVLRRSQELLEKSLNEVGALSRFLWSSVSSAEVKRSDVQSNGKGGLLSPRELEIVQLLARGKRNREIAGSLGISIRTVETHRAKIMLKLGLRSVGELVRYAVRNRIVEA